MKETFLCGAAKENITPQKELLPFLRGLNGIKYSRVHDELFVRVLALELRGERALIVGFDLDKSPNPAEFMAAITKKTGVQNENITYMSIHTHSAPLTSARPNELMNDRESQPPEVRDAMYVYEAFLLKQLLKAVEKAVTNMKPAKIGCNTRLAYLNVNRNLDYADGQFCEGNNYEGSVDHRLFVMEICAEEDKKQPLAFLINYPIHNVIMFLNNAGDGACVISADMGGNVCKRIEAEYQGAVCLWSSGAAGDTGPIAMTHPVYPDEKGHFQKPPIPGFETSLLLLDWMTGYHYLDVKKTIAGICSFFVPHILEGKVEMIHTSPGKFTAAGDPVTKTGTYDIRLHFLRIGDIAMVGIDGELYSSYGNALIASSPLKNTIVINHDASLLYNQGYIYDAATLAKCRTAAKLQIPGRAFWGNPEEIGPALTACFKKLVDQ
jgi:hypothetical protein